MEHLRKKKRKTTEKSRSLQLCLNNHFHELAKELSRLILLLCHIYEAISEWQHTCAFLFTVAETAIALVLSVRPFQRQEQCSFSTRCFSLELSASPPKNSLHFHDSFLYFMHFSFFMKPESSKDIVAFIIFAYACWKWAFKKYNCGVTHSSKGKFFERAVPGKHACTKYKTLKFQGLFHQEAWLKPMVWQI